MAFNCALTSFILFLTRSAPFNSRRVSALLMLSYRWLNSQNGNERPMLRYNGFISNGSTTSGDKKMSVAYDIVELRFNAPTIKCRKWRQSVEEPCIRKYKPEAVRKIDYTHSLRATNPFPSLHLLLSDFSPR